MVLSGLMKVITIGDSRGIIVIRIIEEYIFTFIWSCTNVFGS